MENNNETLNLNNLRKLLKKEQYGKALELCEKTLAQNPADIELYKVKYLCCINLQKFQDALEIADFNGDFVFEKAYCLYRMNKLQEALNVCNSIKKKSNAILNLQAQTLYKLQRYDEATSLYHTLLSNQTTSEIDTDLYTNLYSASISAGRSEEVLNQFSLDESSVGNSFDLMFNIGSAQISIKDLSSAHLSLQKSLEICKKVLAEDGLTDEEIVQESRAIRLQISLVDILNGNDSLTSLELCRSILRSTKQNNELVAVAANNLTVLRGSTDLPDSLRRLKNTITSSTEEKLTKSQLMDIRYNRSILLLHTKKFDECLKSLDELDKLYGITTRSLIIRASVFIIQGNFNSFDELLNSTDSSLSSIDTIPLSILNAQSFILRGMYAQAEEVLNSLVELKFTPAVISTIYQLKQFQSSSSDQPISFLLSIASKLDEPSLNISDNFRVSSLYQIAQELQEKGYLQETANVLKSLLNRCSSFIDSTERSFISSQLAIVLSFVNPEEAKKFASSTELNTHAIDPQSLEHADIPRLAKKIKPITTTTTTTIEKQKSMNGNSNKEKTKETKRLRILRRRVKLREQYLKRLQELGKYDPSKSSKPDPERWIPLKHRSYNKRGRKNRNKFVGGQGSGDGAQKDMLKLDAYARSMAAAASTSNSQEASTKRGVVIEAPTSTGGKKGRKKR